MVIKPDQSERDALAVLVNLAKAEDLGEGDITCTILPAGIKCTGKFIAREKLIFCGGAFLEQIAASYDEAIATTVLVDEGAEVEPGKVLAEWSGPAGAILSAERVALNFLQRLSGIATMTRKYVDAVAGTSATIYDTRKTTPAWRRLEKYAVRVGGGKNHRLGLYDAVIIKDNHLAVMNWEDLAGKIASLRKSVSRSGFIEIEVDNLEQLREALAMDVDVIMLDNMPVDQLAAAVAMRNELCPSRSVELEASGGITLQNVRQAAETGVERIAIGALTHSAPAVDIAMEVSKDNP